MKQVIIIVAVLVGCLAFHIWLDRRLEATGAQLAQLEQQLKQEDVKEIEQDREFLKSAAGYQELKQWFVDHRKVQAEKLRGAWAQGVQW